MEQKKGMPERTKNLLLEKAKLQKELAEAEAAKKLGEPEIAPEPESQKPKLERDPMYTEALGIVAKLDLLAYNTTLQRVLGLDDLRVARILKDMETDGIIGSKDLNNKIYRVTMTTKEVEDFINAHEFDFDEPAAEPESIPVNEEKQEPPASLAHEPTREPEPEFEYEQGQERTRRIISPDSKAEEEGQELKPAVEARDSVSSIASERHPERNEDATLADAKRRVWGVFDGVGDAEKGEVASRLASDYMTSHLSLISDGVSIEEAKNAMSNIIIQAGKAIQEKGDAENSDMSTTGAVLKIHIDETGKSWALVGSVGDSRVYKIGNDGKIEQVTEDDDVVRNTYGTLPKKSPESERRRKEIVKKISQATNIEDLDEEERFFFGRRNEITQSLGNGDSIPNIYSIPANEGDGFLITSDGIHDNLTTEEIEQVLKESKGLEEASDNLVKKSVARSREKGFRSKQDDMSAIVVEVAGSTIPAPLEPFGGVEPEPYEAPASGPESLSAQVERLNTAEAKPFPIRFLERKIKELLNRVNELEKINDLKVEGKGGEILIALDFEGQAVKRMMGVNVSTNVKGIVTGTLENKGDSIALKESNIKAGKKDKPLIEKYLKPKLSQVSEMIKGFIEKEEKKKVVKMEIVNGQLMVTFEEEKSKSEKPLSAVGIETKTKKTEAIERLKEIIANAERVIEEEERKIEERNKRLVEIRAVSTNAPETIPAELPEDIRNIIDVELNSLKQSLKSSIETNDKEEIEDMNAQIKLLEDEPIKYWTEIRDEDDGAVDMLEYVSNDPEYAAEHTKEEKEESITHYREQIEELTKIIDALKAINPNK